MKGNITFESECIKKMFDECKIKYENRLFELDLMEISESLTSNRKMSDISLAGRKRTNTIHVSQRTTNMWRGVEKPQRQHDN